MKYIVQVREDNSISRVGILRPKSNNIIKKGRIIGVSKSYNYPDSYEEITKDTYNMLVSNMDLPYCKWINSGLVHEPQEEKESRLKLAEENRIKQQELKEKEDLKGLLLKLKGYVKFNKKATDLLNE